MGFSALEEFSIALCHPKPLLIVILSLNLPQKRGLGAGLLMGFQTYKKGQKGRPLIASSSSYELESALRDSREHLDVGLH